MFQPAPRRHRRLPTGTMVSYAEVKSYLSKREIPQLFESLMAGLMYHRPENHIGYLQSCLEEVRSNSETKVQWSTFVNAKKRKSKEILPPLTPKKQDSFSSSWSDNSRQSTPLPPISARTRTRTSLEQQDLRNTYILYHNPPPILAKPKVPVISVLGGLGTKIDELCERVVGRLRGVVHISTCSMLKTRMAIEGFYRVTSVPACAVVDSVLQAMSMVQSANALLIAGFPRNRGDIEEYGSRRVRMDGVVLVDFEEEVLRRFLEHEVATGVVRKSEVEAELERFKQDIISVAEYYDEKELLTVVMGDQDPEEIIDDLVMAVDKVIETRKDFVDEDTVDVRREGESDGPYNAIIPSPDRLERPSTVEIRDATEEDIKSLEVEANNAKVVEAIDADELSAEKANSAEDETKVSEGDGTDEKAESEIEGSVAKPEEDVSNNAGVTDNMEVAAVEKADLKEMIDEDEINAEKNANEGEIAVEKNEDTIAQKSDEDVSAEKGEPETEAPKSEEAEKSEKDTAEEKSEEVGEEKSEEVGEEKSEENVAAEVSENENKEKSEGEKANNEEGEKEAEKSESGQNAENSEGEKAEKSENENEDEKSEEKGSGLESAEDQKEEEEDDKDIPKDSESNDQSHQPSDIEAKDVEKLNNINNDDEADEKSEANENNGSENDGDPTDDKEASEKNIEEELRIITPNIPIVFAFENINIDYDEIRNLIANDLEMCFIDFHELMRNDGSNDDKFDNDEALRMLSGILKQDSVSYSNGFFVFKFPFSLLDENNIEELLKLGNLSFVCKVRENKSESESESKDVKEEKLFHSSLSEKVKIIFVTEDNVIDELRQALHEMIENKNAGEDKHPEDKVEEIEQIADKSEKSDGIENKAVENTAEENVSSADGKPSPGVNENEMPEVAVEEKEDESNKNDDIDGEEKSSKDEKDEVIDKEIPEKEDVVTEEKANPDDYEDSTGKDIEDLVSDDTLNEGSKPPESLQSEENLNIPDEAEVDNTHSQASTLASAGDETQKEKATLERQSGIEMETDNTSVNEEDNNKPKLVRQSTYSADEEIKDEEKEGTEAQETSQNEELPKVESIKETSETKNGDEIEEGSSPKEDGNISEPISETKEIEDTGEAENENVSNNSEEKGDETSEAKEKETELDENKAEIQSEAEKSVSEEQQPEIENEAGEGEANENIETGEGAEFVEPVNESPEAGGNAEALDSENEKNSNEEISESANEAEGKENAENDSGGQDLAENDDGSMKESPEKPDPGEVGPEQENVKENEPEDLSDDKIEPTDDSAKSKSENEGNEIAEGSNAEDAEQTEKDENEESAKENSETKEHSETANKDEAINDNENVNLGDQDSGDEPKNENEEPTPNEEISKAETISQEKEEEKEVSQKSNKDVNEEEKVISPEIGGSRKHKALDNDSDSNDENVTIETQAEIHAVDCVSPPTADAELSGSKNDVAETAENENLDQNEDDHSSAKNKQNEIENETSRKETILGNETEALTIEDMDGIGNERYSGKRQERNGSGILDESREQDQRESEEPQERSSSSSRGEL